MTETARRYMGNSVPRKEDPALLTGRTTLRTTSVCRGRCTWPSCAARTRTPGSRRGRLRRQGAAGRRRGLYRRGPGRASGPSASPPAGRSPRTSRSPTTGRWPAARSTTSATGVAVVRRDRPLQGPGRPGAHRRRLRAAPRRGRRRGRARGRARRSCTRSSAPTSATPGRSAPATSTRRSRRPTWSSRAATCSSA